MTQPSRVIYLPPGVTPAAAQPTQAPVAFPGIPFDRNFFEHILPQSIQSFCSQVECKVPVVELLTVDGTTHYVNGISGVSDQWVALHTAMPDHEHPVQVFIPYQTIFRVEIHPAENERRHRLGFLSELAAPVVPPVEPPKDGQKAARAPRRAAATKK